MLEVAVIYVSRCMLYDLSNTGNIHLLKTFVNPPLLITLPPRVATGLKDSKKQAPNYENLIFEVFFKQNV